MWGRGAVGWGRIGKWGGTLIGATVGAVEEEEEEEVVVVVVVRGLGKGHTGGIAAAAPVAGVADVCDG